jgi:hypothetical protein
VGVLGGIAGGVRGLDFLQVVFEGEVLVIGYFLCGWCEANWKLC